MRTLLAISTLLFFSGCFNDSDKIRGISEARFDDFQEIPTTMMASAPQEEPEMGEITKKVVKTGGINFQSKDIQKDYQSIKRLLPAFNAYIENENQSRSANRIDYSMTIRVPDLKYDTLYSSVSSVAFRLDHKYSNVEDVTERYYDLKSRIKNKKALEQRYIQLLEKASEVKDLLQIERNLNQVRTEIEQLQGQFNFLSKQVSLSTLNLTFYEVLPYVYEGVPRRGFGARILKAFDNGWQGFLSFLIGFASLWPFVILTVGGFYAFRLAKRKWKSRK